MPIKVAKFGGSSLADAAMIRKVQAIVEADPERRYIVPSAPGKRSDDDRKITDLLYLCHEHVRQGIAFDEVFELIAERYRGIVADLGLSLDMGPYLEEVRGRLAAGDATPDYAASRGEYLNGRIIAALLGYDFVDAADIIHFDANGRFDPEKTHASVSGHLSNHERAVIPGFYGSSPDGTIKTFSRGGSDVTGAIIARGVGASVYENWTDVSGLLMADPRIVDDPRVIEAVTYQELRELAYMGAGVLHDEAIFPVRQAGIPVNIRNTNEPDHPGTMIIKDEPEHVIVPDGEDLKRIDHIDPESEPMPTIRPAITGIAGHKDFTVIAISKAMLNNELGFARRLLEAIETNGINFEHMPSGIDTISVVISDDEIEGKLESVEADIRAACHPDELDVYPEMALIATVGRGMMHAPGMAAKLFDALAEAGVNVRMIDQGSSELNIIVGVAVEDFEPAIRAIYEAFVG